MRFQLATLVRGSSVTAHCPAAPAPPIREYQADYRRQSLTSGATCTTPLDISFHIRGAAGNPAEGFGGQVAQVQGAAEHRSERIQHTRSEERRSLLRGPRLRGMARGRWVA
jgi:hypothetical protein